MQDPQTRRQLEELAILDALDVLDADERAALIEGLAAASDEDRAGVEALRAAATTLSDALTPPGPSPSTKDRLLARVAASGRTFTVRSNERAWEALSPAGVLFKTLSVDTQRQTAVVLLQLAAGSEYPGHRHAGPEDCYVLAGEVTVNGEQLRAGDFHHADVGSDHAALTSEHGAELLLVVDLADYVRPAGR